MNYYSLIMMEGLKGIVTLANFPSKDKQVSWPSHQIVHVLWSDGDNWQFRALDSLEPGELKSFSSSELPSDYPGNIAPFFCMSPEELPQQTIQLPVNNLMGTTPAWRANIKLESPYTSSSYQGEYTMGMLSIPSGTLLSIGTLVQFGENISNKFILPNLHSSPEILDCTVSFMRMYTKEVIKTATVRRNDSTVIDLKDLGSENNDPIIVTSTHTVGIPLFLTHDSEFKYMSFEHTHPPSEMVFLGQPSLHQQNMKKWWFQRGGRS
jgi:hypothetical protein